MAIVPDTRYVGRCVHLAAFSRRVLIYGLGSGRKATEKGRVFRRKWLEKGRKVIEGKRGEGGGQSWNMAKIWSSEFESRENRKIGAGGGGATSMLEKHRERNSTVRAGILFRTAEARNCRSAKEIVGRSSLPSNIKREMYKRTNFAKHCFPRAFARPEIPLVAPALPRR